MSTEAFISDFKQKTGRLPSQVELSKELNLSPQRAIAELMQYIGTKESEKRTREASVMEKPTATPRLSALQVGLLAVAAITFGLSVYFTSLWFTTMFSLWIALPISVSMVSYMVLSPQVADKVNGFVKLPLWATFTIALVFSMGSTVAGQYNQLTSNIDVTVVNERALLDSLRAEEAELVARLEEMREQQAFHQQTLQSLSQTAEDRMENAGFIWTERTKVNELGDEIAAVQGTISSIRQQIRAELEAGTTGATVERSDFYSWLAGLVGMGRSQMEFLISALPAIFIDIIAALSLNLALAIGNRYTSEHGATS